MWPPDGRAYWQSGVQADFNSHRGNVPEVYFKSIIWCSIRETTLGYSGKAYFTHPISQVSSRGPTEKSTEEPQAKKKKKCCRRVNSAVAKNISLPSVFLTLGQGLNSHLQTSSGSRSLLIILTNSVAQGPKRRKSREKACKGLEEMSCPGASSSVHIKPQQASQLWLPILWAFWEARWHFGGWRGGVCVEWR